MQVRKKRTMLLLAIRMIPAADTLGQSSHKQFSGSFRAGCGLDGLFDSFHLCKELAITSMYATTYHHELFQTPFLGTQSLNRLPVQFLLCSS